MASSSTSTKKATDKVAKASRYTDPELRDKLKRKIKKSDKGGKKGSWSARKAQRLVKQYEKRGGGYTTPRKDSEQRHLAQWATEDPRQHVADTPQADAGRAARPPLRGYDRMSVAEVVEALEGRTAATIRKVLDHERAHRGRVTLVRRLERRLG